MKRRRCNPKPGTKRVRRRKSKPQPVLQVGPQTQPGEKPKGNRRRYKVDRFPPDVRLTIYTGFVNHDPYWKIRAAVKANGHDISEQALSRYWRNCWFKEVGLLREARLYMELICQALKLGKSTESGKIAEELLYTLVIKMHTEMMKKDPVILLREAREQEKTRGGKAAARSRSSSASPAETARSMHERWRQLYGLSQLNDDATETEKEN